MVPPAGLVKVAGFLRQPVLHLLLIGGLLFLADRAFAPEPSPLPPIVIDRATQTRLHEDWQRDTGRAPNAAEWQALLRGHVDEEIMVREALARDLARRDPVVRARLIDNLRFVQPDDPRSDATLLREALALGMAERDLIARRRLVLRLRTALDAEALINWPTDTVPTDIVPDLSPAEPLIRFEQRFFHHAEAAELALAALKGNEPAESISGDPFLLGSHPVPMPASALSARWGADIAQALQAATVGVWSGPVASPWGWHLLRVEELISAAPDPAQAQRQAYAAQTQVMDAVFRRRLEDWRAQHPVVIEGAP